MTKVINSISFDHEINRLKTLKQLTLTKFHVVSSYQNQCIIKEGLHNFIESRI